MRRTWTIAIPLLVVLVLLMGIGAGACEGGEGEEAVPPSTPSAPTPEVTPSPPPTTAAPTPTLPKSGEWTASTEFGELKFTVNPDSTGIAKVSFNFTEFKCGGAQASGGVSVEKPTLWSITGGQFTIDTSLSLGKVVIKGKFDETGTHASGTWEINICSGTWESSRGS